MSGADVAGYLRAAHPAVPTGRAQVRQAAPRWQGGQGSPASAARASRHPSAEGIGWQQQHSQRQHNKGQVQAAQQAQSPTAAQQAQLQQQQTALDAAAAALQRASLDASRPPSLDLPHATAAASQAAFEAQGSASARSSFQSHRPLHRQSFDSLRPAPLLQPFEAAPPRLSLDGGMHSRSRQPSSLDLLDMQHRSSLDLLAQQRRASLDPQQRPGATPGAPTHRPSMEAATGTHAAASAAAALAGAGLAVHPSASFESARTSFEAVQRQPTGRMSSDTQRSASRSALDIAPGAGPASATLPGHSPVDPLRTGTLVCGINGVFLSFLAHTCRHAPTARCM